MNYTFIRTLFVLFLSLQLNKLIILELNIQKIYRILKFIAILSSIDNIFLSKTKNY